MLSCLQDARLVLSRPLRRVLLTHARAASSTSSSPSSSSSSTGLDPSTTVAQRLYDSGVWAGRSNSTSLSADRYRVNVVDDGLCDDIVRYIEPSLKRHRGCDLLDINPGPGVWSRKLHDALQPRKHVLMEQDTDLYAPLLSDLVAKDNVELIPKSGLVWDELNNVIRAEFPNQKPSSRGTKPPLRNDTLLVTLNLSHHPAKAYKAFQCVSDLVLYQFISSIRTGALFQKYGLVRMLIWVNDERKRKLLPRAVSRRRRAAFEAELACEWVREIAGKDREVEKRTELRDEWINRESGCNTMARMKRMKLKMPEGRETSVYLALKGYRGRGKALAGVQIPELARPFKQDLEELEAAAARGEVPDPRLKVLRLRERYSQEEAVLYLHLLRERDAVHATRWGRSPERLAIADAALNDTLAGLKKNIREEYGLLHDNYHLFRQPTGPVMFWDQRPFEPLNVRPSEFFPNVECALLDIQPRAMHPLLRDSGGDAVSANMAQMMLRYWFSHSRFPISKAMDGLWPGFSESVSECPSLRDPKFGGSPFSGLGEMSARCVNQRQWGEIVTAMINSPFRPTYAQMVSRLLDGGGVGSEADELRSGAMGSGGF